MTLRLRYYWDKIRSGFWFLPSIMAFAAISLALGGVALDGVIEDDVLSKWRWIYSGGADGAVAVLSVLAGSLITITALVFSLTMVVLSNTASQFGPRLLRNMLRDTANQFVLGTFVATFLYCLMVLRTVRRTDDYGFVPHISVTVAVLLAIFSLGVLIFYIHHVSVSIQAERVIAGVAVELLASIDRLFPEMVGQEAEVRNNHSPRLDVPPDFAREARPVAAAVDGYLQAVDAQELLELAVAENLLLRLEYRPGHYIVAGMPLALVWPGHRVSDGLARRVNDAFVLGSQRTPTQDVEFAIHQLVEIALRALSPGINDPFTAIACIDRLGSALARLAARSLPSPHRSDDGGKLRIIARPTTFPAILNTALHQLRQAAQANVAVSIRLLEMLAIVARHTRRAEDRDALREHAGMIERGARDATGEERDRADLHERYQSVLRQLDVTDG